jgi:hypothetical protein
LSKGLYIAHRLGRGLRGRVALNRSGNASTNCLRSATLAQRGTAAAHKSAKREQHKSEQLAAARRGQGSTTERADVAL